ncbi:MAG: sensor histidine kinase [Paludibacter sp.]
MKTTEEKIKNIKRIEVVVFTFVWMAVYAIPYLIQQSQNKLFWDKILFEWIGITAFLIIFILNTSVLVPRFLFHKKYLLYIVFALAVTIVISSASVSFKFHLNELKPVEMPRMEIGPGMPPMELGDKMPMPQGYRSPEGPEKPSLLMQYVNSLIISLLVLVASIAFKMISKWLSEESLRKDVEKEQLKTELALLRHQVSPHFFMNTLNNIHALIDINTETAKDAVLRLSTLMRYLLYETTLGHSSLKKELEFIESYISLMKLRFTDKVSVSCEIPSEVPDIQIPAMLFVSFIENAFKHGVSYRQQSYIQFSIAIADEQIICLIRNSKHNDLKNTEKKYSGIGMQNVKKSLELLFEDKYQLDVIETTTDFEVKLNIPYYDTKMHSH